AGPSSVEVQREGGVVTWSLSSGTGSSAGTTAKGTCMTGVRTGARLSVGVRAPAGATSSLVRNVTVTRLGT
ncbi:MAG: hypothetical protein ACRENE_21205, partial [Polyangiaceae bacterium]